MGNYINYIIKKTNWIELYDLSGSKVQWSHTVTNSGSITLLHYNDVFIISG